MLTFTSPIPLLHFLPSEHDTDQSTCIFTLLCNYKQQCSIRKLYKWNHITLYLISCSFLLIFYIFKIDSYWYMQVVTSVLDCMDIIAICALSCWWITWVFTIFFCYKHNGSKHAAIPVQISLGTSISQSFSRESWQRLMHLLSLLTELSVF